ncbi:MAG: hypothetical protein KOO60_09195 [Gemmatimonadales bacterium]|nr:hypothetical protein [Gemmatimonadales bacterium]
MNGANNEQEQIYRQEERQIDYQEAPGVPKARVVSRHRKSAVLATVLSMMPGLGQIYVGYYQHGFVFVLIPASIIALLASGSVTGLAPLLGMFLAFFWIFNMIDANRRANHFNRAVEGLGSEDLPEDFQMPGTKGSIPAGMILMAMGLLIILDLNFGISMEWIENWWPLALVAFGGYLVFKARSSE